MNKNSQGFQFIYVYIHGVPEKKAFLSFQGRAEDFQKRCGANAKRTNLLSAIPKFLIILKGQKGKSGVTPKAGEKGVALRVGENSASSIIPLAAPVFFNVAKIINW